MRIAPDDPRRSLPMAEWPEAHRRAFEAATRRAGLLDEPGALAHLVPLTLDRYTRAWGHFLTDRRLHEPILPDEALEACLPQQVAGFIRRMQNGSPRRPSCTGRSVSFRSARPSCRSRTSVG